MSIQTKKLHFIQEILKLRDERLIDKLYELFNAEIKRSTEGNMSPLTIDELNLMIDKAESDVENGKVVSADELLKSIQQWR